MANHTIGKYRNQYDYVLTIYYPGNPQYELYTANNLGVLTDMTGIIVRTRHLNKINKYNSKLLGTIYFTIERYNTGTSIYALPRKRRRPIGTAYKTKCFLFSSYGNYTEEQLNNKANEYFSNKFGIHLQSLIEAINNNELSIEDLHGIDINEFKEVQHD